MNKLHFKVDLLLPYLLGPFNEQYRKIADVHTNGKRYPLGLEMLKSLEVKTLIDRIKTYSTVNKRFRDSIKSRITSNIHFELLLWMIYMASRYLDMWKILHDNSIVNFPFYLKMEHISKMNDFWSITSTQEFKLLKNDATTGIVALENRIMSNNKLRNHYSIWYNWNNWCAVGNVSKLDKWPVKYCDKSNTCCMAGLLLTRQLMMYANDRKITHKYVSRAIRNKNNLLHVIDLLDIFIEFLEMSD